MTTKHFLITGILFLLGLNAFSKEQINKTITNYVTIEIFTSQDKDYLQLWHYDQVLRMDLSEKERDEYFSVLNTYTYKMSRLGLSKYKFTDSEWKYEFIKLANKLDAAMKSSLSINNYKIHHETFDKIEHVVYQKRDWEE